CITSWPRCCARTARRAATSASSAVSSTCPALWARPSMVSRPWTALRWRSTARVPRGSCVPDPTVGLDVRAEVDRLIAYHGEVAGAMTAQRTALESALIPVIAYILVAAAECWYRHPDMVRVIDAAMP